MGNRTLELVAAAALSIAVLAAGTLASAAPSHVVHATNADRSVLRSTFVQFKMTSHEMATTDHITWSRVRASDSVGPLMAYDAVDHRYWALANFNLVLPASYAATVSFQDGGSYGVFHRSAKGKWIMKGYGGVPLCPRIVPAVVAHLWHLANYPAC